jgi:hypothetical protein
MIVGVLTVDLAIFEAQTLKDKRRVIRGLKDRLMNQFNVSVAEVDFLNSPKRCRLGLAVVSGEARAVHSQLDHIVDAVRRTANLTLLDYERRLV